MKKIWRAKVSLQKGFWAKVEQLAQSKGQRIDDVILVGARRLKTMHLSHRSGAEFSLTPLSGAGENVRAVVGVDNTFTTPAEESTDIWSEMEERELTLLWGEGLELRRVQRILNLTLEQLVVAAVSGFNELSIRPSQGFKLEELDEDEILRRGGSLGP